MPDLRDQLQSFFGLDDFRPSQREVIEDVLRAKDVLCVMPTGAGKSLCFQLPAAIQKGLTIVVSPLISLMEDQVQQLRDEGIPAALLNSSLSVQQQRLVLEELRDGFDGLLYVAPERFNAPNFQSTIEQLKPKLLAIDEAHCISQWGHDFRPEYSRLGAVREKLGNPPTIALTATATDDTRADIIRLLKLRDPTVVVTGFDRPNLLYESRRLVKTAEKDAELLRLVENEPGSCIVYCSTRKNVDAVTMLLSDRMRGRPVFAYHAGMDQTVRTSNQERFMQTAQAVAVATNAFGMGINKPDVRLVAHYNLPGTLEAYYQEAGRAGRDGQPARCVVLFSYQDRYTQEYFIDKIGEDNPNADPAIIAKLKSHATTKLEMIIKYCQTHLCRRRMILDYFGDLADVDDCSCDVCQRGRGNLAEQARTSAHPVEISPEAVLLVKKLLSAIARCKGKFGIGVVADVLTGSESERTSKWGLDKLSVFGLLKEHAAKRVIAMLHRLVESGLARQRDPDGVKFRPVIELTHAGAAVMKGEQLPPASLADLAGRSRSVSERSTRRIVDEEPSDADVDPAIKARFDRLRSARLDLARSSGLPPYCICHDATLRLIARRNPADAESLEQIKGMGPNKVRLYGEALLAAARGEA